MASATTIPETVTVPGQIAYDVLVRLSAIENGLLRLSASGSTPMQEDLLHMQARFFEAAFGEPYMNLDSNEPDHAPLVQRADKDGWQLLRDHFGD